jgi:natural product precursor
MKKSNQGKLSLKKETVARLNDAQMNDVRGGTNYLLLTLKCPVIVIPTRTIPPCTISTNTLDKTIVNNTVVNQF